MDAFESLIAELLRRQGYWTIQGFHVELSKEEKREIKLPSCPRWELDILAYKGGSNELLAVECKSYLDSRGVLFRNGKFEFEKRYKLFSDDNLRTVVFRRLVQQLEEEGFCPHDVKEPILCLAAGKLAKSTDRDDMDVRFKDHGWRLFDPDWIGNEITKASQRAYTNDVAHVVAKLLLKHSS